MAQLRWFWVLPALSSLAMSASAQDALQEKGRATFERVCGTCHKPEIAISTRRSRAQWQESISSMVLKGLKAPDDELNLVLDYLAANHSPTSPVAVTPAGRGRGPVTGMGADDKHVVDAAAAERGRKTYAAECINCHGTHTRGLDGGADLVRSLVVLHDRYGNELGPFLAKGHPTQTTPSAKLSKTQVEELSQL